jgi:hypothetical protein
MVMKQTVLLVLASFGQHNRGPRQQSAQGRELGQFETFERTDNR